MPNFGRERSAWHNRRKNFHDRIGLWQLTFSDLFPGVPWKTKQTPPVLCVHMIQGKFKVLNDLSNVVDECACGVESTYLDMDERASSMSVCGGL